MPHCFYLWVPLEAQFATDSAGFLLQGGAFEKPQEPLWL